MLADLVRCEGENYFRCTACESASTARHRTCPHCNANDTYEEGTQPFTILSICANGHYSEPEPLDLKFDGWSTSMKTIKRL